MYRKYIVFQIMLIVFVVLSTLNADAAVLIDATTPTVIMDIAKG